MIQDSRIDTFIRGVITQAPLRVGIYHTPLPSVYELAVNSAGAMEIFYTRFFHKDDWLGKRFGQIVIDCIHRASNFYEEFQLTGWQVLCSIYVELIHSQGRSGFFFKVVYTDEVIPPEYIFSSEEGSMPLAGEELVQTLEYQYNKK